MALLDDVVGAHGGSLMVPWLPSWDSPGTLTEVPWHYKMVGMRHFREVGTSQDARQPEP